MTLELFKVGTMSLFIKYFHAYCGPGIQNFEMNKSSCPVEFAYCDLYTSLYPNAYKEHCP